MRRGMVIGLVLLAILLAVGVGIGAYNAGLHEGVQRVGTGSGEVVRVIDDDGPWFFPFGFLLFPLFFFGFFALTRLLFWRGRWGHWHGHGGPPFDDWHRRQHEERPQGQVDETSRV